MTCRDNVALLNDLVDGDLSPAQAETVERHLQSCSSCRAQFEDLQDLKKLLGQGQPAPDPGPDYWAENSRLILARTVELSPETPAETAVIVNVQGGRKAFLRALASLAASLVILASALAIGQTNQTMMSRSDSDGPFVMTSSLAGSADMDDRLVTADERVRMARGMTLMAPPGPLGRYLVLTDIGGRTALPGF